LPDIAHITNDNRLHPISMKGGDQAGCLLVLNIFHLMFEFLELSLFRPNQLFPTTGAFLLHVDPPIEFCHQFVTILPLRAEQPSIHNEGVCPIVSYRQVDFT